MLLACMLLIFIVHSVRWKAGGKGKASCQYKMKNWKTCIERISFWQDIRTAKETVETYIDGRVYIQVKLDCIIMMVLRKPLRKQIGGSIRFNQLRFGGADLAEDVLFRFCIWMMFIANADWGKGADKGAEAERAEKVVSCFASFLSS